jgi:uncharacterized protein with von Willebrand factor type A (vWA) domain
MTLPSDPRPLGGVIHSYQKYDPTRLPSPTAPPPDMASAAMEHMLQFGSTRELTEEELANAITIDPSQIAGLGPSLESLIQLLEERKRKILETYTPDRARKDSAQAVRDKSQQVSLPDPLQEPFERAVREEQLRDLERIWYRMDRDHRRMAGTLMGVIDAMRQRYEIEELAANYTFSGRESLDVPAALEIKEELEAIDKLLEQLREAMKTARIGLIDMDALRGMVNEMDADNLEALREQVSDYVKREAERQGITPSAEGMRLSPKAYRLFQQKLLRAVFSELADARSGRHDATESPDGAIERATSRAYEFGDSPAHMDVPQTLVNAVLRDPPAPGERLRVRMDDLAMHRTQRNPRCASALLIDMSGSMRHGGLYVHTKRMALALEGLIRTEYPGDVLRIFEVFSLAKATTPGEIAGLLPKPVTIFDPIVRLKADMSNPQITESMIPPHFTNIQHGLRLARQTLAGQDTPNKQIMVITDGLPTAHFEGSDLYLLYPPDPLTEAATMREATACAREGITINLFLIPSWNQTREDIQFAHRLAESTKGRVIFASGDSLERFVLWDYVNQRRSMIG